MMTNDKKNCKHVYEPEYEDHMLLGLVYYGKKCKICGHMVNDGYGSGPLELGTYQ